ncbi:uncharacterized protein RHOBADRAFT_46388 [Rhodotorula graminis WP1]|uniref:Uncharacterized protein n=1 Tax=Rhodotorula graminis (strain WP1) TaxID=578459 RepID=A0A0P9EUG5_RHOGW|nr:uncharacterized protein RHOBADRAFT_46388 [Rhodotorula graminis WP1]KPV72795.1 hypothetical protein RHOBADRAFT_46388 [Rhodotorula graminis WP1]
MAPSHDFVVEYEYAVIAVERAARASHHAEQEEWEDNVVELLIGREFWDMFSEPVRLAFIKDMAKVEEKRVLPLVNEGMRELTFRLSRISSTLDHMRKSFNRVQYFVNGIARRPPRGAGALWSARVHLWFKEGVLDRISAQQFDAHNDLERAAVVEEFDVVAHHLGDGRLRHLPPLHEDEEDDHDDMFSQLKAMLFRHNAR